MREQQLLELAARQYGVVSSGQLRRLGFSPATVWSRQRAGRLHPITRGVYAVGHMAIPPHGRWLAAVLGCGVRSEGEPSPLRDDGSAAPSAHGGVGRLTKDPLAHWGAAISHRSAAMLWGLLPTQNDLIHVSVAGDGGREQRQGVHTHRSKTLTPDAVTVHQGIPVTTPRRTIEDLRRAVDTRGCPAGIRGHEIRTAIRQAEIRGLPTGAESVTRHTRSDVELAFLQICEANEFPLPRVNSKVGHFSADFLWAQTKLIVETDSYRYHRGEMAFEDDYERNLFYRERGYEVVRISTTQIISEPERVALSLADQFR